MTTFAQFSLDNFCIQIKWRHCHCCVYRWLTKSTWMNRASWWLPLRRWCETMDFGHSLQHRSSYVTVKQQCCSVAASAMHHTHAVVTTKFSPGCLSSYASVCHGGRYKVNDSVWQTELWHYATTAWPRCGGAKVFEPQPSGIPVGIVCYWMCEFPAHTSGCSSNFPGIVNCTDILMLFLCWDVPRGLSPASSFHNCSQVFPRLRDPAVRERTGNLSWQEVSCLSLMLEENVNLFG